MSNDNTNRGRLARIVRRSIWLAGLLPVLAPACLDRPIDVIEPRNTFSFNYVVPQSQVDKIDILLVIDDSGSMGDKQDILSVAVPDLVNALVNPDCVNPSTSEHVSVASPLADCPADMRRDFEPVLDIHVGVISTSLGPRGGNTGCTDDNAMLVTRVLGQQDPLPTFEGHGFLAWDPQAPAPAVGSYQETTALNADLSKLVLGVGQTGCGLEAQMESWYRFLVDPKPYAEVVKVDENRVKLDGIDSDLLKQRAAFLRPDSLVAVVMLTDENDCSFKPNTQGFFTANYAKITALKARAVCQDNPNDPCCAPCGHEPEQCPVDPTCAEPQPLDVLQSNLTCFHQKQRFGVDFLYDTSRYVDGLTKATIKDRDGDEVDNPLFVSPNGELRGNDKVFFAGIVGVPWQLIARNKADLKEGFKTASELTESGAWSEIVGDPANNAPPSSPYMVESIYPRAGLAPPNSDASAEPINGHEYNVDLDVGRGDLQYACIFDLPEPIQPGDPRNECGANSYHSNDPLCQAPDNSYGTTQYRAKAFPGLRHLEVLRGIGDQAIVGSICPAQLNDAASPDYGYRPAIGALVDRLKIVLRPPCLPRPLVPDVDDQQVSCLLLEGRPLQADEVCNCDHKEGRLKVSQAHAIAATEVYESDEAQAFDVECICEIEQLKNDELFACQNDLNDAPQLNGASVDGWCYVDEQVAKKELVAHCEADKQTIRFVGEGHPVNNSLLVLSCHESNNQ